MHKTLILIGATVLAIVSAAAALGANVKNTAPELALSLFPENGFAAEKTAINFVLKELAARNGQFPNEIDSASADLAKRAFLAEPLTPGAITVMALSKSRSVQRKLMTEALALSRRQKLLTSWMIVDSGDQEDIPALLGHYDTLLRTSPNAALVLIPIMAQSLSNDAFIDPYSDLLSTQPVWSSSFWGRVASTPEAVMNAAKLRKKLYEPNETSAMYNDAGLIWGLVKQRKFDDAEKLYQLVSMQDGTSQLLRNGSFDIGSKYPPFDWQLFSTGEYGASISQGSLNLNAINNSGGLFARQLLKLPNSVVTLSAKFGQDIPSNAELYLDLSCAEKSDNNPKSIKMPQKSKRFLQRISNKNASCEYYWLSITGRSSDGIDGFDVIVESIEVQGS